MKRFSFPLQAVLNVKSAAEDLIRQELSQAQGQLEHEEGILSALRDRYKQACGEFPENVAQVLQQQYYREALHNKIQAQSQLVRKKREIVHQVREKMIQAEKECKIMEKLKEHRVNEFRRQALTEEQGFLDEIAVAAFTRAGMKLA